MVFETGHDRRARRDERKQGAAERCCEAGSGKKGGQNEAGTMLPNDGNHHALPNPRALVRAYWILSRRISSHPLQAEECLPPIGTTCKPSPREAFHSPGRVCIQII